MSRDERRIGADETGKGLAASSGRSSSTATGHGQFDHQRHRSNEPKSPSGQEAVVNELLSYAFTPLRDGDIALYRGSGNGLAPILLVTAAETSLDGIQRLEHEFALKAELDADWAARSIALTHYKGRMTLVLEDPGGAPLDRLLGPPLDVSHFLRIAIPLAGALRQMHE